MKHLYQPGEAAGPLLTIPAAAARLAVSRRTVERLIRAGQLQRIRIGGAVRIDPADLTDYIARARAGADTGAGAEAREAPWQEHENKTETASTGGTARRTGGHRRPTDAADRLAAVLAFGSPTTRRGSGLKR